jgi:hypothetical protein
MECIPPSWPGATPDLSFYGTAYGEIRRQPVLSVSVLKSSRFKVQSSRFKVKSKG